MATPTSGQPYHGSGGTYAQQATQPQAPFSSERASQGAQGQYVPPTSPPQFDKYCIIHVATTCDEHGVYVTKDSAEVIEIGWVVVDAKDPSLPEVCAASHLQWTNVIRERMARAKVLYSSTTNPSWLGQSTPQLPHFAPLSPP